MVAYEDGLNDEVDRINHARIIVEEDRIYQGLVVCNRHEGHAVYCFPCGQQSEDDNHEIIEPPCGDLRLKVI